MADPTFDPDSDYAVVTGLPGVAFVQSDAFFDSAQAFVAAPPADVEFLELQSSRGSPKLVSVADLATLLGV